MAPMDRPAPVDKAALNLMEQQVKDVIQDLFQVMVQVTNYDSAGKPSREVLANELQTLSQSLQAVHTTAESTYESGPRVPQPLVEYVENGRNPDIYTREFVELVRRMNQMMKGRMNAFSSFRDVLADQMMAAMPELREDVARVVEATGGKTPLPGAAGGASAGRETPGVGQPQGQGQMGSQR